MRRCAVLALALVLAVPAIALADKDPDVTGTYEVKYEDVANNCTAADTGVSMARGTIKIDKKAKLLTVDITQFPLMQGSQAKGGKLRASSKVGPSPIDGADVKASIAGQVEDGLIRLVFVAEYYVGKKPLCTQSWNVNGVRKDATAKSADAPVASPMSFELLPFVF